MSDVRLKSGTDSYFSRTLTILSGESISDIIDLGRSGGQLISPAGLAIDIPAAWTAANIGVDIAKYQEVYPTNLASLVWLPLVGLDGDAGARAKLTNIGTSRAVTALFPFPSWAIGNRRYIRLVSVNTSDDWAAVNQAGARILTVTLLS